MWGINGRGRRRGERTKAVFGKDDRCGYIYNVCRLVVLVPILSAHDSKTSGYPFLFLYTKSKNNHPSPREKEEEERKERKEGRSSEPLP